MFEVQLNMDTQNTPLDLTLDKTTPTIDDTNWDFELDGLELGFSQNAHMDCILSDSSNSSCNLGFSDRSSKNNKTGKTSSSTEGGTKLSQFVCGLGSSTYEKIRRVSFLETCDMCSSFGKDHFHCTEEACNGMRFLRREEIVRHLNYHRKKETCLEKGFLRFSSNENCEQIQPKCSYNGSNTHYHCLYPCCEKVILITTDLETHRKHHLRDSKLRKEGFIRFSVSDDCNVPDCLFLSEKLTHFHCARKDCQYGFRERSGIEKHKTFHAKNDEYIAMGFTKCMKGSDCHYPDCEFSVFLNHFHCIFQGCVFSDIVTTKMISHQKHHKKMQSVMNNRNLMNIKGDGNCLLETLATKTQSSLETASQVAVPEIEMEFECNVFGHDKTEQKINNDDQKIDLPAAKVDCSKQSVSESSVTELILQTRSIFKPSVSESNLRAPSTFELSDPESILRTSRPSESSVPESSLRAPTTFESTVPESILRTPRTFESSIPESSLRTSLTFESSVPASSLQTPRTFESLVPESNLRAPSAFELSNPESFLRAPRPLEISVPESSLRAPRTFESSVLQLNWQGGSILESPVVESSLQIMVEGSNDELMQEDPIEKLETVSPGSSTQCCTDIAMSSSSIESSAEETPAMGKHNDTLVEKEFQCHNSICVYKGALHWHCSEQICEFATDSQRDLNKHQKDHIDFTIKVSQMFKSCQDENCDQFKQSIPHKHCSATFPSHPCNVTVKERLHETIHFTKHLPNIVRLPSYWCTCKFYTKEHFHCTIEMCNQSIESPMQADIHTKTHFAPNTCSTTPQIHSVPSMLSPDSTTKTLHLGSVANPQHQLKTPQNLRTIQILPTATNGNQNTNSNHGSSQTQSASSGSCTSVSKRNDQQDTDESLYVCIKRSTLCMFAGCTVTMRRHYHCSVPNCTFQSSNVRPFSAHHRKHVINDQKCIEGFKHFTRKVDCLSHSCAFRKRTGHFHCTRRNCRFSFTSKKQMEIHKRKHERRKIRTMAQNGATDYSPFVN